MVLPCLMSVLNSIGVSCFGWIGERISAEAAHLISYEDNIENLRTQLEDLDDAIDSVQNRIEHAANIRGETLVDPGVARLLKRMTTVKEEASKIITDEERSSDCTCIIRLGPNLWACYRISKSAKKAIDKATELVAEEKKHERPVANLDHSKSLGVTPNPDFEELESRKLISSQIVEVLKDPNVQKVGVYGMGGTGKTTLAKQIGAELYQNGTFSYVVLATVSENQSLLQNNHQLDLINIQKQIAGGLKIQLKGETLNDRATELCEQLQKREKLLIILDDIWSKFEFETVGIPVGSSFTSKFTFLMTSRSKMVLENEMDSTKNFELDSLPIDDARSLFDKMVGGDAHYSNWPLIAHQVVELCGGVPILLVTIGRALRNATQSIWEDALTQLKRFDGDDIDEEGYKKIEVSYNFLKNQELKKLFLLCAQLEHRYILIDDLLKYAIGLNLFNGRKKVKEVSNRLHKYLRDLKGCCLLQDGDEEGIIKMHDVIHKFASYVASRDHDVFSVANDDELEEWPSKDELENFSSISLPYCHLPPDHMLPAAFDNPKLESFLMLRSNIDASFKIPDNFFAGMKGLKLLDLTSMSLSPVLVSSLSALVKLQTLCLDYCELNDITVICELPLLQALSLVGSSIVSVPKEMGQLGGSLKLLDLRYCWKLESIASGVISKLTLMEDLRIGESFSAWERLEGTNQSNNHDDFTYEAEVASLEEFKKLQNLINIEIHVSEHAKMFPKDLVFKKLETFRIFIGSVPQYYDSLLPKALLVDESLTVEFDSEGSKTLMTAAESLRLAGVTSCVSVSEMDPKGFPELKHLHVEEGYGIQYIVKKNYNDCIFPKLETLDLYKLSKLERIWDDHPLPVGSFENLRVLSVWSCDLLHYLLSFNLAKGLLRLKEIRVTECDSMKSIIVSTEEIKIGFTHQLQVLSLSKLPRLVSFDSSNQIEGLLPSPTPLFNKTIVFPKLEELELFDMEVEKIWDDEGGISAGSSCWFQNLTTLWISNCSNLQGLAPPSPTSFKNLTILTVNNCPLLINLVASSGIVKSLVNLKEMSVSLCNSMEEIVGIDDQWEEAASNHYVEFEKLELQVLTLSNLPRLVSFCSFKQIDGLPSATHLFNKAVVFPKLEELSLFDIKAEKIWDDDEGEISAGRSCWLQNLTTLNVSTCYRLRSLAPPSPTSFKNLTTLSVFGCPSLKKLIASSSVAKSLANLKEMCVNYSECLEEIVGIDDRRREESASNDEYIVFEKLEVLKLEYLRRLISFCSTSGCNFRFPSLKQLHVESCYEMQFFSKGTLSIPKILRVELDGLLDYAEDGRDNEDPNNFIITQLLKQFRAYDVRNLGMFF